jgi:hypothetical protein
MLALAGLAFGLPWVAWGQAPTSQSAALPAGVERVLKYVPDDTHLLIIVPSMDGLATGVAAFGKAIVLPELAEVNAREMLTEMLGANAAALDTHGALVLALSAAHDEPLLLATLARDEGWKGTTQPTRLDDETLVCEFGPERFLAASTNGVAILAREKSELRRALEARGKGGERCAAALAPCLAQRQVALYVDIPAWKSVIDAQMTLVSQGMYMGMAAAGPDAELGMQVWNWMLEQVKNIVAESRTFVATVRIDAQGVFADGRATFDADGQVVRYLQGVQRPRRDLLRGLPTTTAPVLMAFEWEEAPGAVGPQEAMSRAILRMDAVKEKIDGEKLATVMKQTIEMNRRVPGSSAVFSFSPEERGLLYWGLYLTREGPAVQREMRSIWELTPELVMPGARSPARWPAASRRESVAWTPTCTSSILTPMRRCASPCSRRSTAGIPRCTWRRTQRGWPMRSARRPRPAPGWRTSWTPNVRRCVPPPGSPACSNTSAPIRNAVWWSICPRFSAA